jgi:hypothetical protein
MRLRGPFRESCSRWKIELRNFLGFLSTKVPARLPVFVPPAAHQNVGKYCSAERQSTAVLLVDQNLDPDS